MKVRAQIAMVLNLDKCIGCHTCSVTCKQVWTSREGVEYAWFNNVESKPGIGYPKEWENQEKWKGGWTKVNGKLELKAGGKRKKMDKITWGPNWEDDLAGEFHKRAKDKNFSNMEKEIYKQFENTFHMYLP